MSLLPYKVTALARVDNGDLNIIPNASVTVLTSSGMYAQLYEADETTPIGNPFNCDDNGERQIYLSGGSYSISVAGGQSWEIRLSGASDIQSVATIADLRNTQGSGDDTQVSLTGDDDMRGGLFRRVTDPSLSDDGVDVIRYAATNIYWLREDSAWYNDVHYLHPKMNSSADVTFYCDPVTGSDTTGDGTLANPWQTWQKANDMCPRILTHKYIIDLRTSAFNRGGLPAIYDEDVVIRDIHGPMTNIADPLFVGNGFRVLGAGPDVGIDDPTDVQVRSLTISGCTGIATPEILGLHVLEISPYYEQEEFIAVYGTMEAQLYNLSFASGTTAKAGVRAYGSGVSIKGIDVTNVGTACWAKRGAYAVVSDVYGTYSNQGVSLYRSEEASDVTEINSTVTGITDPTQIYNYNYGMTYDAQGIVRSRATYFGSKAIGTSLGQDALGLGHKFTASAQESIAIGLNATSSSIAGIAAGSGANAGTQPSNVAIGQNASTTGSGGNVGRRAVAVGASSSALFENSIGLGYQAAPSAANRAKIGNASLTHVETQSAYEVLGAGGSIYLRSPDNTRYRISIANGGDITVTAAP